MIKLHDYLGSIVSSFAQARAMSDLQSIQVAQEYAKHPLLRHLAVPRMRIEGAELTIPIALASLTAGPGAQYRPFDQASFMTAALDALVTASGTTTFPAALTRSMVSKIAAESMSLERQLMSTRNLGLVAKFVDNVVNHFAGLRSGQALIAKSNIDLKRMKLRITDLLSTNVEPPPPFASVESANVVVEADQLREKLPENLIYIKLKISEEGMEWHRIEHASGQAEAKLLPE